MNALTIEQAFKTAAEDIYAPLTAFCGSSGEILPNEDVAVIFLCEECEHKAGQYWTALLKVEVDAPALADDSAAPYTAAWQALLDWFEDKAAVAAAFPVGGVKLNGFFVRNSGQSPQGNRWIASITILAGVEKHAV